MARGIAVGGVVIGLLGLALGGLSWRRGKTAVTLEPPPPALDGDGLAMASAATTGPGAAEWHSPTRSTQA